MTTKIRIIPPNVVFTSTYLTLGTFKSVAEAENFKSYIQTKFVRYLILITLSYMHISRNSFSFVPVQDFSKPWTDAELYAKYGLTDDEIKLIEATIKPMK